MDEDRSGDAPAGAAAARLVEEFLIEALRLRLEMQRKAAAVLERLYDIAMDDNKGAVQVSAAREFLEQTLGRTMAALAIPAKLEDGSLAAHEAAGIRLREKLDRMADRDQSASPEGAEQ